MIYLQVKAKSGLHAGAVWQLSGGQVSLGAASTSDVFLCDPEVPDSLITFKRLGRRFEVHNKDPQVRLVSSESKKVEQAIFPSQLVYLDFRHIQLEIQVINAAHSMVAMLRDHSTRSIHHMVQLIRGIGAKALVALLFIIGLLLTTMILFFGTAGVAKSQVKPVEKSDSAQAPKHMQNKPAPLPLDAQMAKVLADEVSVFADRIAVQGLEIVVNSNQVSVSGEVSRVQMSRFEQELARYASDYGAMVDIRAQMSLTQEQRRVDSIEIEQIILGSQPLLILRDGARVYLGGSYNGVELTAVNSEKVVFKGETQYEVTL